MSGVAFLPSQYPILRRSIRYSSFAVFHYLSTLDVTNLKNIHGKKYYKTKEKYWFNCNFRSETWRAVQYATSMLVKILFVLVRTSQSRLLFYDQCLKCDFYSFALSWLSLITWFVYVILLPGYVSPKRQSSSKRPYPACTLVWTRPQLSTWQSTTWCSCEMLCYNRILQLLPNYTRYVSCLEDEMIQCRYRLLKEWRTLFTDNN